MHDPWERRSETGMIETGADTSRISHAFLPALDASVAVVRAEAPDASVFVYGSVATGQATIGRSDVDLLTIGLDAALAGELSSQLSARFANLCRSVEIAAAAADGPAADDDEAYGFQVFLRHYCVHLAGPDKHRTTHEFSADARAARGFNGDIGRHLDRWRSVVDGVDDPDDMTGLARRVSRKSLLAVAGLVSIHDEIWTTDRRFAVGRWSVVEPDLGSGLQTLASWIEPVAPVDATRVRQCLTQTVEPIVERFSERIGLWPAAGTP